MLQFRASFLTAAFAFCSLTAGCSDAGEAEDGPLGGSGGASGIDACAIITQADASKIFGKEAEFESSSPLVNDVVGSCTWAPPYQEGVYSQTLGLTFWRGAIHMGTGSGAEPLAIGDKGYVKTDNSGTISIVIIKWLSGEIVADLQYATFGPSAPEASTKKEQLKSLAVEVAPRVPSKAD